MKWTKYHLELALYWGADLRGAYLQRADLQGTDLQRADLRGADLQRADLQRADLQGANLQGANLRKAYLRGAYLRKANLQGADLQRADLRGADLQEAYLQEANLQGADLQGGAKLNHSIVPEKGSFIAFKKLQNNVIAELEIPAKAKRSGGIIGRKCRAEYVKVLKLSKGKSAYGVYDKTLEYKVGKIVKADGWNTNPVIECTQGIHFFMTRQEAVNY